MTGRRVIWRPNPGPQTQFLASSARECGFGGAAGGGKSAALVAIPTRWIHVPQFRGLIVRRETNQLRDLIDKSRAMYRPLGGVLNETTRTWKFPSGATVWMNHMENANDWEMYQGLEFQFLGVDEGTTFLKRQFLEAKARVRSSAPGLPRIIRWTSNPGGKGHEWVFERYAPWLSPACKVDGLPDRAAPDGSPLPPALPGQVLWVTKRGDQDRFHVSRVEDSESRQFIPARLTDNPKLMAEDPGYARALQDLDPVRRAQLERGDWLIKPAAGLYFQRGNFEPTAALPRGRIVFARYWDRAATVNGDWTAGVKMAKLPNGIYVIVDVVRFRGPPALVEANIKATAALDGRACVQVLEQDPGQAGVAEIDYLVKSLAGFNVRKVKPTGDKVTKAGPFSAQCAAGNVKILYPDGNVPQWVGPLFAELEGFPDGDYDDQVDAASGAFTYLTAKRASTGSGDAHAYGDDRRSMDGFVLSRPC